LVPGTGLELEASSGRERSESTLPKSRAKPRDLYIGAGNRT
jgi:hypothetical protein